MNALPDRADLTPMSHQTPSPATQRGDDYKRRRLAAGFRSVRALAEASGIDRTVLADIEKGEGTDRSRERLDIFLERWEEETSSEADELDSERLNNDTARPIPYKIELGGVYGIDDVTFSGGDPEEVARLAAEFMHTLREDRNGN